LELVCDINNDYNKEIMNISFGYSLRWSRVERERTTGI